MFHTKAVPAVDLAFLMQIPVIGPTLSGLLFDWIPSEIVQTIPFAVTVLALILFSYRAQRARQRRTVSKV